MTLLVSILDGLLFKAASSNFSYVSLFDIAKDLLNDDVAIYITPFLILFP